MGSHLRTTSCGTRMALAKLAALLEEIDLGEGPQERNFTYEESKPVARAAPHAAQRPRIIDRDPPVHPRLVVGVARVILHREPPDTLSLFTLGLVRVVVAPLALKERATSRRLLQVAVPRRVGRVAAEGGDEHEALAVPRREQGDRPFQAALGATSDDENAVAVESTPEA